MLNESDRYSRIKTARQHEIATSVKPAPIVRIGDRDPQTNLHKTLDACGNEALNGEKIFSSVHKSGDIVRATRAGGSGIIQLDSINARSPQEVRSPLGDNCSGYFNGQIFSCEEEQKKLVLGTKEWLAQCVALNFGEYSAITNQRQGILSFLDNKFSQYQNFQSSCNFRITPFSFYGGNVLFRVYLVDALSVTVNAVIEFYSSTNQRQSEYRGRFIFNDGISTLIDISSPTIYGDPDFGNLVISVQNSIFSIGNFNTGFSIFPLKPPINLTVQVILNIGVDEVETSASNIIFVNKNFPLNTPIECDI